MAEAIPSWAIDAARDRLHDLSLQIQPKVLHGEKGHALEQLQDEYALQQLRIEQLLADTTKIDVYPEFDYLCTKVSEEVRSFWRDILQNETRLTAIAASVTLSAAIVQAIVVGVVISLLGTTIIRSKRYLFPHEKVLNARDDHAHRIKILTQALLSSSDLRMTALAIEKLGMKRFQDLLRPPARGELDF